MAASSSLPGVSSARTANLLHILHHAARPVRALANAAVFLLKVYPMLPSRPVDWVTKPPVVEKVKYPTRAGLVEGELLEEADGVITDLEGTSLDHIVAGLGRTVPLLASKNDATHVIALNLLSSRQR